MALVINTKKYINSCQFFYKLGTCFLVLAIFLYFYFVIFVNIYSSAKQTYDSTISDLNSKISQYEIQYMEKQNALTFDMAKARGLEKVNSSSTRFVKLDNNAFSLNDKREL